MQGAATGEHQFDPMGPLLVLLVFWILARSLKAEMVILIIVFAVVLFWVWERMRQ